MHARQPLSSAHSHMWLMTTLLGCAATNQPPLPRMGYQTAAIQKLSWHQEALPFSPQTLRSW